VLNVKVLGPGCANCERLEQNTKEAVTRLGQPATVEKVSDVAVMMSYGILRTPALVVNGKVAMSGRVPSPSEILSLLTTALAESGAG
jgi:small redox-active disulfide protein 2